MYYKYLIIQTDTEDYYVECSDSKFYDRLCSSIPTTSELRGWHGSNDTEGSIELGHQGAVEIFGRDIIAIAEGTIEPPWNPRTFRERLIEAVGEEHVHDTAPNIILVTDKTILPENMNPENATVLGGTNCLFHAAASWIAIPYLRATDHDVAEVIKSAKRWLSERMPNMDTQDKPVETSGRPERPRIVGLLTYTPKSKTLQVTPSEITLADIKANLLENPPKFRCVTQGATMEETAKILRQVIPSLEPDEWLILDYANLMGSNQQ